jgi:hypothetical protein
MQRAHQGVAAAVRAAGDLLLAALETQPPPPYTPATSSSSAGTADTTSAGRGPDALLRHGALGSRVAAAVAAALSPARADERDRGLGALRVVLKEEATRQRAAESAVVLGAGEDSGGADELLMRLALTLVRFSCHRLLRSHPRPLRGFLLSCPSLTWFANSHR